MYMYMLFRFWLQDFSVKRYDELCLKAIIVAKIGVYLVGIQILRFYYS